MSEKKTETVWTFNYSTTDGSTSPIETSCEAGTFGYPNRTVDGAIMHVNTHFRTKAEAWRGLIANADASQSMDASNYREAQVRLRHATDRLAASAAFASDVHAAHAKESP